MSATTCRAAAATAAAAAPRHAGPISKKRAAPTTAAAPARAAQAQQRLSDARLVLTRPEWECFRCDCPDYEHRGRWRSPPHCKHCLGVACTLTNDHAKLHRLDYFPDFVNDDGPLGYVVPEGRAWNLRASSTQRASYQVVVTVQRESENKL